MEQQWFFVLLEKAKDEIKRLRAENILMAGRLEMFDSLMSIFNAQKQQQGCGMAPDIVYDIEKVIAEFCNAPSEKEKQVNPELNGNGLTAMRMQEDRLRHYTKNDFGGK